VSKAIKSVYTKDLFDCEIDFLKPYFDNSTYPWEILPKIKDICKSLLDTGIEGYTLYKEGVLIGKDVSISNNVTINAPCIIGHNTEIRPGAFIRGNVIIGSNCVIGNSCEYKNAILLDHVQTPHYNYVGDSILGNYAHTGAGTICSNLKSDGSNIVIHAEVDIPTGLRKIGGILADHADVGCNSVINPGTVIGKSTRVYPLTRLRGIYPSNSIVKDTFDVVELK